MQCAHPNVPNRPRLPAACAGLRQLAAAVTLSLAAFAATPAMVPAQTTTPAAGAAGADVPQPASAEQVFVLTTAETTRHLSEASRLAVSQARSAEVRELAQQIATDHGQIATTLESLSRRLALPLPASPVSTSAAVRDLVEQSGGKFDRAYVLSAHEASQRALRACEAYLEQGRDADLRAFAGGLLPILRSHVNQTQELASE